MLGGMANQSSFREQLVSLAEARPEARQPLRTAGDRPMPRKRLVMQPGLDDALARLAGKTKRMKRARFNAQERFEAKNRASILALTIVSILSIALSMYSGTHSGTEGFAAVKPFLDFMSISMSLLVLSFGFIVALGNYQDKSLRMQRCAMDLTRLLDDIENARILNAATADQLSAWTTAYNDIIRQCPYNHSDVDSEKAGFSRDTPWHTQRLNSAWRLADVWGLHGFFFILLGAFWMVAG